MLVAARWGNQKHPVTQRLMLVALEWLHKLLMRPLAELHVASERIRAGRSFRMDSGVSFPPAATSSRSSSSSRRIEVKRCPRSGTMLKQLDSSPDRVAGTQSL